MPLNLVVLVSVFVHTAFSGARVAVSLLAIHLHATPLAIGAIMSLFAVLPMLFSVSVGRMVDRVGIRKPMVVASLGVALGTSIACVWQSLPALCVVAAVVGSAFMLYHIAVSNLLGALGSPADRPRNFSVFSMGFSVSGFAGPMMAGFAIDHLGFAPAFLVLAIFPLATLGVLLVRGGHLSPSRAAPGRHGPRRVMDLLESRAMRKVFIVSGTLSMGWDIFTFLVPIYAARIGHSASTIGVILGAFSVATFAVRVALPALVRRVGEWRLLATALCVAAVVYLLYPLVADAPLLIALAFVLGLGLGSSQPMVMSLVYNTAPAGRAGEAVGVRTTLVNASQTFMPLVFGAVGSALGMLPVFWSMAVLLGLGGLYARRR